MTDRERWIVYPLLFLALGISLRTSGKFGPTKMLSCERLHVEGADGKPGIELVGASAANGGGGQLRLFTENSALAVELRATPQGGVIEAAGVNGVVAAMGANGRPQAILESTPAGGALATFAQDGTRLVVIEPTRRGAAITAFGLRGGAQQSLVVPWNQLRIQPNQAPPDADKPKTAEPSAMEADKPAGTDDTEPAEPSGESRPDDTPSPDSAVPNEDRRPSS